MRTVFGADEQSEVEVDVLRWVRLARMVLDQERVPEESEMSVIFVDEQAMSDLHERFLGGSGPTDVLAFPMDDDVAPGGRQPDQGGRGPGLAGGGRRSAHRDRRRRGVPAGGQAPDGRHEDRSTTRSRCSSSTVSCIC